MQWNTELIAYALFVAKETNAIGELLTYSKALSHADLDKWIIFMHKEIESFQKNKTWEFVKQRIENYRL